MEPYRPAPHPSSSPCHVGGSGSFLNAMDIDLKRTYRSCFHFPALCPCTTSFCARGLDSFPEPFIQKPEKGRFEASLTGNR